MYPAFPQVALDLGATATQVQLTLTTFFVGMALGQLVGGPVSDQRGRRRPLLISLVVLTLASVACAWTSSIWVMMALRFVQGLSGGWAMVTARAIVIDLARGIARAGDQRDRRRWWCRPNRRPAAWRPHSSGGVVALVVVVVAAMAAAMVFAVAVAIPETLPVERRHGGELRATIGAVREVAQPRAICRLPARTGVLNGGHVRLRRHVGVHSAVDERTVAADVLGCLRRQRCRSGAGHPVGRRLGRTCLDPHRDRGGIDSHRPGRAYPAGRPRSGGACHCRLP